MKRLLSAVDERHVTIAAVTSLVVAVCLKYTVSQR